MPTVTLLEAALSGRDHNHLQTSLFKLQGSTMGPKRALAARRSNVRFGPFAQYKKGRAQSSRPLRRIQMTDLRDKAAAAAKLNYLKRRACFVRRMD